MSDCHSFGLSPSKGGFSLVVGLGMVYSGLISICLTVVLALT